jgi:hypothetical protein
MIGAARIQWKANIEPILSQELTKGVSRLMRRSAQIVLP